MPGPQARITDLRRGKSLAARGRVMQSPQGKRTNACLAKLGQARRYKTAILLIRAGRVEKITRLNKEINPLADREIRRLLERMAQALFALLALARSLARGRIAKMVISSEYNCDYTVCLLIWRWSRVGNASFFHILF